MIEATGPLGEALKRTADIFDEVGSLDHVKCYSKSFLSQHQNSSIPGAGLIGFSVDRVTKLFQAAADKEDVERIRREIQELKVHLNSNPPQAVQAAVRENITSKQEILSAIESNDLK